jgi:hypothetical protein
MAFSVGERVWWREPVTNAVRTGTIKRLNETTASVATDEGGVAIVRLDDLHPLP